MKKFIKYPILFIFVAFYSCDKTAPIEHIKGSYYGPYYLFPFSSGSGQSTDNGAGSATIVPADNNSVHFLFEIPLMPDSISNVSIVSSNYDFQFFTIHNGDTFKGSGSNNQIHWRYIMADTSISFTGSKL